MRKPVLYVLTILVAAFYVGVAGAAVSPYYGAVTGFIGDATRKISLPHLSFSSVSARDSSVDGVHSSALPGPAASATALALKPRSTPTPTKQQLLTQKVKRLAATTKAPRRRINLLVLGSDNDAKFDPNAVPPTQVMIVVSIDPVSRTISLFSIPRDSWVHIPGYGYNTGPDGTVGWSKIQVASGGGFNAAACTVETNFGIPIDDWVWVGLNGFIKVIDTMNGVSIDVTYPVLDDTYPDESDPNNIYAFRRIYIPPGPQHLRGDAALHFVRSRHGDAQSDFGRSSRQQIVIQQLRRALLSQDAASLVALVPSLLSDFQGEMKTSISPDIATAARYWSILRAAAHYTINQIVLLPPYSNPDYHPLDHDPAVMKFSNPPGTPFTQYAVELNWALVNQKLQSVFGTPDYSAPHCHQSGQ